MRKLLSISIGILLAVSAFAQKEHATVNWPYLYPEFRSGELQVRSKTDSALFNIHLDFGALHYVQDGKIKEANILNATTLKIDEDLFCNVGGRMLKVLARAKGGYIVQEVRSNYAAVVKKNGQMGTTALNSTTTRTFLYNENVINGYNGYLLTDVYADLLAMKDEGERLPVRKIMYMVMGLEQIPAERQAVLDLDGIDKKAFKAFLKSEKIDWTELGDLVKVMDYITTNRK